MNDNTAPTKGELIEQRLDKGAAGELVISSAAGGVAFQNMLEVMEFAKLMALAGSAVPPHLRNNPGACLAATVRALELKMSPFTVANWQYEVENKGVKRIAYESQFYHACIEARAPIKTRLAFKIIGEGEDRRCKIWATLVGEREPRVFTSDTLGKLRPPRNEYGTTKGSPLWDKKPDLQLFYNASRDFARIYFPDVLGGLYTKDELEEMGPDNARDVTDKADGLHERLAAAAGQDGFKAGVVDDGLNGDEPKPKGRKGKDAGEATPAAGQPEHQPATAAGHASADAPAAGQKKTADAPKPQTAPSAPQPQKNAQAPSPAKQEAPKPDKAPTNPAEYLVYARAWLAAATTAAEIDERWKKERSLRNAVGLTSDERQPLESEKKVRMAQLGGAQ